MRLATLLAVGLLGGIAGQVFGAAADFSEEMTTLPGTRWGYYTDGNAVSSGGIVDGGLARSIRMGTEPDTWHQTANYDVTMPYSVTNLNPEDNNPALLHDDFGVGMVWLKKDETDVTNTAIGAFGTTYTYEIRFKAAYPDNNGDLAPDTAPEIIQQLEAAGNATVPGLSFENHLQFATWGYRTYRAGTSQGLQYGDYVWAGDPPAPDGVIDPTGYMWNSKREHSNGQRMHAPYNSLIDNQWHTLRIMSDHSVGGTFNTQQQGRTRFVVDGVDINQSWDNAAAPVGAGADPLTPTRLFALAIGQITSNPGADVDRRVDLNLDYVRYTDSILPDNEPLTAEGTGTPGTFTLSGTTTMFIGGVDTTSSLDPTPGTDSSRVRATGTLTLGGTLRGLSRNLNYFLEGPVNAGFLDRAEQLPDIGQGGNLDEFGDPIPAEDVTLHRGKKISRAIMTATTMNGSFSSITFNDENPATTLNEKGVFIKTRQGTSTLKTVSYPVSMNTPVITTTNPQTLFFEILNAKVGDADGDEIVSATDVFTAVNNLGAAVVGQDWNRGNFDGDNLVSATDVFAAVNALGAYTTTAVASDVGTSSIPEPTSGLLMVLAMGACAGLRRSRQGR